MSAQLFKQNGFGGISNQGQTVSKCVPLTELGEGQQTANFRQPRCEISRKKADARNQVSKAVIPGSFLF